ncbi:DNA polymerase III subunit alpha [Patescibacteria group bacterium]|nr:DNA polymerase III subunit alpha [Patescibacteria group bacterium]MBU1672890.1 DNA polymerase III subunit alpha [Patescibacteria group bacterium]MBU1963141.1 DNA polymerase III subunit alpha [Patescibacteria group bacterium]
MNFTHLHTHSHYSLLDGLSKIDELVKRAKKNRMKSLALTDHGVMYGIIEFYEACKDAGIKPIIGIEAYVAPNGLHNKRPKVDEGPFHLILLAKNQTGYENLLKLSTIAHLEGFYYKPRIDLEILKEHSEGLIASTACLQGEIPKTIIAHGKEKAREAINKYLEVFPKEDFYLEVQHNPSIDKQEKVNSILKELAEEMDLKLIATNDVHYLDPEDDAAQDALVCIQTKKKLDDKDRLSMVGEDFSMKTKKEMEEWFKDMPDAVKNTEEVADKCNLEIELGKIQLPHFELPEGITPDEQLRNICFKGLEKRYGQNITDEIKKRMDYELDVIKNTGFASYFLIVADFVNWAKEQGIVVGPGRGSAAGSIVAFLTGITNIDPIKYELLFERFLNPERVSMPDIDLDFADTRRDEVIRYVESKYGKDKVAQIITFGTMAARAAVRDVGRVLGVSYSYCDQIAKLIPMFTTLDQALKKVPELKEIYRDDPDATRLLDLSKKLEGVARHSSTHACGVVITKEPLTKLVPLQYPSQDDQAITTQYSLHPVEDLGLLKMDFLGLKNLTIIENTLSIVEKTIGEKIDIDQIPLEDKLTFELLQKAATTGVFQLESSGMKRYLRDLKPTDFEDIIAMVSLYRPGPMEWIPDYIKGKKGLKQTYYLHPSLKPILEKTFGVAIYQEQVMKIAQDLAGYSLGEADVLRKAVAKKIPKLLAEQKEKFIAGSVKNGVSKKVAEKVFEFIEPFAGYGFNRSHGACYAMIAYQTAYLKANYPAQFMAALLTSDHGDTDRIAIEVSETEDMGINVMPPSINESFSTFTVVKESLQEKNPRIRFGLSAIKNVGANVISVIIAERRENGPYNNLEDFLTRVQDKDLNKKSLESLIKTGALDEFGERNMMLSNIESLLAFSKNAKDEAASGQTNLFGQFPVDNLPKLRLAEAPEVESKIKLGWEKELLGLYISDHPLNEYKEILADRSIPFSELPKYLGDESINIIAVVTTSKKIFTRKGDPMLFVTIEDQYKEIEAIVFPKTLEEYPAYWESGNILELKGKLDAKEGDLKLIVEQADIFNPDQAMATKLLITMPSRVKKQLFNEIRNLLIKNKGNYAVYLNVDGKEINTNIRSSQDVISDINRLLGQDSVILV